jgi:hypothetical protein
MRSYFLRHVDRWIRQNTAAAEAAAGTESDPMRRRLMKENAWMQAQGLASEFRLNLAGSWQARSLMMSNMTSNMASMTVGMNNDALWRSNGSTGMSASVGTDRDFLWGFMLGFRWVLDARGGMDANRSTQAKVGHPHAHGGLLAACSSRWEC